MTNTKHTPAPWEYNGDGFIVHSRGDICSIDNGNEANARLIAAAPELLAACRKSLPFLRGLRDGLQVASPNHDPKFYEPTAIDAIEAAIAKAEGAL